MTLEEKAKAYDEALEQAKRWHKAFAMGHNYPATDIKVSYEIMFPELKESEDEVIRQWIRKELESKYVVDNIVNNEMADKAFAWLEKQGEQPKKNDVCNNCDQQGSCVSPCPMKLVEKQGEQPADKVEPKFKVGKWYQCTEDFFGKGVTFDKNTAYYCAKEGCLQNEYGCHIAIDKKLYDNFKLWTIQDAKDGDVLYESCNDSILLFKSKACGWIKVYCDYWINTDKFTGTDHADYGRLSEMSLSPTNKEQRDLLFQKMKEAGYEWDAEKKELKKIEQKPAEWSEEDERMRSVIWNSLDMECLTAHGVTIEKVLDWFDSLKDRVQPQQKWDEEDERVLCKCLGALGNPNYCYEDGDLEHMRNWLKSLRPQSKQEWTEEDKLRMENILSVIEGHGYPMEVEWLKSLKDRILPQPKQELSEEDIVAIDCAVEVLSKDLPSLAASIKRLKSLRPQNWTKEDKERYISCLQKLSTGNPEQPETINSKWFKEHVYPRPTWKPSDEQMEALSIAMQGVNDPLFSLYQDLKKLKE